jgi:hypothetical protein
VIPIALASELGSSPGRFGLIAPGSDADAVAKDCEKVLGAKRCSVGAALAKLPVPPSSSEIRERLNSEALLVDIEILFAPQLAVDPLALLRQLARAASPRIAIWPGRLEKRRCYFSEPQNYDGYDRAVDDVIILRPVPFNFPDEPCCEIERWQQ